MKKNFWDTAGGEAIGFGIFVAVMSEVVMLPVLWFDRSFAAVSMLVVVAVLCLVWGGLI